MNTVKRNDDLFTEDSEDSRPLRLVFDNPETDFENSKTDNISLFSDEVVDPTLENELFPDKLFPDELDDMFNCKVDPKQPIIRLLPDNPSEEAVLRSEIGETECSTGFCRTHRRRSFRVEATEKSHSQFASWKFSTDYPDSGAYGWRRMPGCNQITRTKP
jgi:hypothetical protein